MSLSHIFIHTNIKMPKPEQISNLIMLNIKLSAIPHKRLSHTHPQGKYKQTNKVMRKDSREMNEFVDYLNTWTYFVCLPLELITSTSRDIYIQTLTNVWTLLTTTYVGLWQPCQVCVCLYVRVCMLLSATCNMISAMFPTEAPYAGFALGISDSYTHIHTSVYHMGRNISERFLKIKLSLLLLVVLVKLITIHSGTKVAKKILKKCLIKIFIKCQFNNFSFGFFFLGILKVK